MFCSQLHSLLNPSFMVDHLFRRNILKGKIKNLTKKQNSSGKAKKSNKKTKSLTIKAEVSQKKKKSHEKRKKNREINILTKKKSHKN